MIYIAIIFVILIVNIFVYIKFFRAYTINTYKICDMNVLIDGRIYNVCKLGFVNGKLIIPSFVMTDIHKMKKSKDIYYSHRGYKALSNIDKLKKLNNISIKILDKDYKDIRYNDDKIIKLAKKFNCFIFTTNTNLSLKSKKFNIKCININNLDSISKRPMLPGKRIIAFPFKYGENKGEAISFLSDGTKIIIEDGAKYLNTKIECRIIKTTKNMDEYIITTRAFAPIAIQH